MRTLPQLASNNKCNSSTPYNHINVVVGYDHYADYSNDHAD
jgi:hypothetical protein